MPFFSGSRRRRRQRAAQCAHSQKRVRDLADRSSHRFLRWCHINIFDYRPGRSIARAEGSDPAVRQTHHRLASVKRDEQAAGRNPWRWAGAGNGAGRQYCRSQSLPIRAGLLGLVSYQSRARAEAKTGLAALASRAIAICVACLRPARSP